MTAIRRYRKDRGLTQEEFATALGIRQATVSRYETGEAKPPLETLIAIANFFGCKLDDLIDK